MCVINEKRTCPKCKELAHFVSGINMFGDRDEQFFCESCGYVFVTRNGRFLREGIIKEPLPQDYPDIMEW